MKKNVGSNDKIGPGKEERGKMINVRKVRLKKGSAKEIR